jgi:uncharacterized delta-60 repeat protein
MSIRRIAFYFSLAFLAVLLTGIPIRSQYIETQQTDTELSSGRNVNMVSGDKLPGGDPWLQRQNEPSIAVSSRNPLHLLAGANDYRTVDMPISEGELPGKVPTAMVGDAWLGVFTSYDGGESWTSTMLPGFPQDPRANPLKGYRTAADPVVRSGPNGLFYYSGIAFNRDTNLGAVFVARFIDNNNKEGGGTINVGTIQYIDTKIIASGTATKFLDKPWIAVDQPRFPMTNITIAGQRFPRHNVYIAYSSFSGTTVTLGDIMFARSNDCGGTFGAPIKISSGNYAHQGATIAIKPVLGEVLVAYRRFAQTGKSPDQIYVAQSFTRGVNFQSPVKVADIPPFDQPTTEKTQSLPGTGLGPAFRTNSYPTMAVDKSGHVYLAWSQRGVGASGGARIVLSSSYLGTNWTSPRSIDPNGLFFLGHQIMPSLSFAGGKLIMVWYDQRNDVSAGQYGFNNWILDDQPYRHTMDVWAAEADTSAYPNLNWNFTPVSRYLYSVLKDGSGQPISDNNGEPIVFPVQFNCVNYELFKGGLNPFMGDYIDVAAAPSFRLDTWRNWIFNTDSANSPVFHVAWTDNRDVRPPLNGDWTQYTPANSSQDSAFVSPGRPGCQGGNAPGMRNQNIYTSRITWGIEAGSPTNDKPLDLEVGRAFVVFVKNNTGYLRSFRLTIAAQPNGGQASFLQFELLTTLDVNIAPYSTISRPVFVSSSDVDASVTINIDEIDASGNVIAGGLKSSVLLNGDPSNPNVPVGEETHNPNIVNQANPNIVNWYVNPNIVNPNIVNPNIVNPNIVNPNIVNSSNPNIVNPNIVNPNIVNQSIGNPNIVNSSIANPNIVNPNIVNTGIGDPNSGDLSITDVEWTVTNDGNTTTSYTLKALAKKSPPQGIYTQLLVYKVHYTPAVAGAELSADQGISGCELKKEPHHELLLNVVNPNIVNPNIVNPNIVNPNIVNASIENATFPVDPGEEVIVDLRVLDTGVASSGLMKARAQTSKSSLQAFDVQDFIDSLGFAVTSQVVNSTDAAQGIQVPPAAATELVIGTASLPDGVKDAYYEANLYAYGGTPGYTWMLNSGELPPGLALSAGGQVSGTPTEAGTYTFIVRVDDQAGQFDTQQYSIFIDSDAVPDDLAIRTTSLPSGVQGFWYGATLEATGGVYPRTWSLADGSLPDGLSLDSGGVISGTPTAAGAFYFTVRVTDNAGHTATRSLSIMVAASTGQAVTISGTIYDNSQFPVSGVLLRGLPSTPLTGEDGKYSAPVPKGWSGTVTPFKVGYFFTPETRTYAGEETQADLTEQDYNSSNWLVKEEWINRYYGPASFSQDWVSAMAMDSSGNAFVTGYSEGGSTRYDYATVKYDSSGNQVALARYNGPDYIDWPMAITVDASGNVYVTGLSYGTDPTYLEDIATIKYDNNLNQLAVARHHAPTGNAEPSSISTDASGNVYVTGIIYKGTTSPTDDIVTIKYSSSLNEIWSQTYTVSGSSQEAANGIAVDSEGGVYVAGTTREGNGNRDIVVVKYNASGAFQWRDIVAGDGLSDDTPVGIKVNSDGDIYLAGTIVETGSAGGANFLIRKYGANAEVKWSVNYSYATSSRENASSMAVDSADNVYVTGSGSGGPGGSCVTVKYDSSGTLSWASWQSDLVDPTSITVDSSSNAYIGGYEDTNSDGIYGYMAAMLDKDDGHRVWATSQDMSFGGVSSEVGQIGVNGEGNVFLTGTNYLASTGYDFYTVVYDSGGTIHKQQNYDGPANDNFFTAMAIDPDGNVVTLGQSGGVGTYLDFVTTKYDIAGNTLWTRRFDGISHFVDTPAALAVDSAGNVYVAGQSDSKITLIKYAKADGNQEWTQQHVGSIYQGRGGLAFDSAGNLYLAGSMAGSGTGMDFLLVQYNPANGGQIWERTYNRLKNDQNCRDYAKAIATDSAGNILVTGQSALSTGAGDNDIATVKYDSGGNFQWAASYDGGNGNDIPVSVKTDSSGNVFVLGDSVGSGTQNDLVTIKYSSAGGQLWVDRYDGPDHAGEASHGLAVDAAGNAYITGGSVSNLAMGWQDYITIKYAPAGTRIWESRYDFGTRINDTAEAIALDDLGNVYVTGMSQGAEASSDFATFKYGSDGQIIWVIRYNGPGHSSDYGYGVLVGPASETGYPVYVGGYGEGAGSQGFGIVVIKYQQK